MFDVEEFTTRVLSKAEIAQDTLAFELERPEGFTFEAGQYVSLRLLDFDAPADGSDDGERALSIASAPHEPRLTIAVRVRDTAFKQQLAGCATDSQHPQLALSPAMGDLVIPPNNQRPIVMLAGGIGITPFYGMLRDLAHRHAQGETISDITLLYGNRTQASSAWSQQLTELTQRLPQLRVVHVFGEDNVLVPTTAERNAQHIGLIDASLIQREIPHPAGALYFVVGPTAMVAAMQDCLDACDVPPDQVVIEFFSGY